MSIASNIEAGLKHYYEQKRGWAPSHPGILKIARKRGWILEKHNNDEVKLFRMASCFLQSDAPIDTQPELEAFAIMLGLDKSQTKIKAELAALNKCDCLIPDLLTRIVNHKHPYNAASAMVKLMMNNVISGEWIYYVLDQEDPILMADKLLHVFGSDHIFKKWQEDHVVSFLDIVNRTEFKPQSPHSMLNYLSTLEGNELLSLENYNSLLQCKRSHYRNAMYVAISVLTQSGIMTDERRKEILANQKVFLNSRMCESFWMTVNPEAVTTTILRDAILISESPEDEDNDAFIEPGYELECYVKMVNKKFERKRIAGNVEMLREQEAVQPKFAHLSMFRPAQEVDGGSSRETKRARHKL